MNKLPEIPPAPGTMLRVKKSARKRGYPNETALIVDSQELGGEGDGNITIMFQGVLRTQSWREIRAQWGKNWEVMK